MTVDSVFSIAHCFLVNPNGAFYILWAFFFKGKKPAKNETNNKTVKCILHY